MLSNSIKEGKYNYMNPVTLGGHELEEGKIYRLVVLVSELDMIWIIYLKAIQRHMIRPREMTGLSVKNLASYSSQLHY